MSTGEPPVLLCLGPELQPYQEALNRLKKICLAPGFEEADFIRLDWETAGERGVREAAATAPFGSPKRLVAVEGIPALDRETLPWLEGYLKRPYPKVQLILRIERVGGRKRTFLSGLLASGKAKAVECAALETPAERVRWLQSEARKRSKRLDAPVAALLAERAGAGRDGLLSALESLDLLAGPERERITEADVNALFCPWREEAAFEILKLAEGGRVREALLSLRRGLSLGRLSLGAFHGAIGWRYRNLWKQRRPGWPRARVETCLRELLEASLNLRLGDPACEPATDRLLARLAPAGR